MALVTKIVKLVMCDSYLDFVGWSIEMGKRLEINGLQRISRSYAFTVRVK